jgi:hypothetical protein
VRGKKNRESRIRIDVFGEIASLEKIVNWKENDYKEILYQEMRFGVKSSSRMFPASRVLAQFSTDVSMDFLGDVSCLG